MKQKEMMPNEPTPSYAVSPEEVIEVAKDLLLRQGFHLPTLIVEGNKKSVATQLETVGETVEERQARLFFLGMMLAREADIGVLKQVFFVVEAWMGSAAQTTQLPSKQPNRREVLMISRRTIEPPQTSAVLFEMKRDKKGKLLKVEDLQPELQFTPEETQSPLLDMFVLGFIGQKTK